MSNDNNMSMGEIFQQRRAQAAASDNTPAQTSASPAPAPAAASASTNLGAAPSGKQSFSEIQAQQEREQQSRQQPRGGGGGNNRNNRGSGGDRGGDRGGGDRGGDRGGNDRGDRGGGDRGGRQERGGGGGGGFVERGGGGGGGGGFGGRGGGGGDRGGGRGGRGGRRGKPDRSHMPLEQGVICSLRDAFGFIHCADREEEIFFHYSEVAGGTHPDDLQMDMEVEFRVGASSSRGSEPDKLAAYEVCTLEPGSIVWELEDEPGKLCRGLVEKAFRQDRGGSGGPNSDGSIRILVDKEEQEQGSDGNGDATTATADGPLVRFTANDFQPPEEEDTGDDVRNSTSRGGSRRQNRLVRGDLVEFSVVSDRRSGSKYARSITLLLSERERVRQEQERKMLEEATEEHGVVTVLKGEYGFLRSNKRREDIYFHYSSIELEEGDGNDDDNEQGGDEFVLKEGQEMKFLVVEDNIDAGQRQKVSARQVKIEPSGSVKFHDVLATGVTGMVTTCPQPVDSGHALDQRGKIRLLSPLKDIDEEGNERVVDEVLLHTKDSPGGTFAFRGASAVGLWIQEGDTLLFDVVKDFVDGTCHAVPTASSVPPPDAPDAHKEQEESVEKGDDGKLAVRLIKLCLASRAEGIVNALKDSYGFVHYSERPVDVHFKLHQVLPDELQNDLRKNMGISDFDSRGVPLKLNVGAEVQFDLSIHGTIQSSGGSSRNSRGGRQAQAPPPSHERENMKAQRVLFLPPKTITLNKVVATDVQGTVSKEDIRQPYTGAVDLDEAAKPMSLEERHPLVAKMIETYLESDQETPLVYHDLQSLKEDDVVVAMLESKGLGKLGWAHLPQAGQTLYPGRLCIRKIGQDAAPIETGSNSAETKEDGESEKSSEKDASNISSPKKKKQPKPTKTARFDKSGLVKDLKEDMPPSVGDVVRFDVVQSRRTGQFSLENMRIVERHVSEVSLTDTSGWGVVKEVLPARNFGFISLLDDTAAKQEMLFFNLSSVSTPTDTADDEQPKKKITNNIRKGDEVKFDVGTEKNGKRVAMNVTVLPKGTIPNEADKNACRGFILLQPAHTTLKNTPLRHAPSNTSQRSDNTPTNGRWDKVTDTPNTPKKGGGEEIIKEEGCILLLEDATNMFGDQSQATTQERNDADAVNKTASTAKRHLRYINGAIAIHGTGSASSTDGSTNPRRGDLVSFMKAKNGQGVRDVRIIERAAATLRRGRLEDISRDSGDNESGGSAKFVAANEGGEVYDVDLSEVVGCDPAQLKEKELVEVVLYDGCIYGLCRAADLYLESKMGVGKKERPKLNLIVKKDKGGKIMAQSMMAKGPDGTNGFAPGWTNRLSQYASQAQQESPDEEIEAKAAASQGQKANASD
jgi:cold shock CspA family protein